MTDEKLATSISSPGVVAAALLCAVLMANVDAAVANIAAPAIHQTLHTSGAVLQLTVSGYVLAYAALLIIGARLGHLFGIRRIFLIGVAGFTIASFACGVAVDPTMLVVTRLAQGAAAALAVPQVLAGIHALPAATRSKSLGAYVAVLSGSAVFGQAAGGLLISANIAEISWRSVFLINVPIGLTSLVLAWRLLPRVPGQRDARLDVRGAIVLTLGLILLTLPLILGRQLGWPFWVWWLLVGSVPVLALFVRSQRATGAGREPLLNFPVLRFRAVTPALLSDSCSVACYFALLFIVALYLQDGLGHSAAYSGAMLIGWVAAFGVAGLVLRRFDDRLVRRAAPWAALTMTVSFALVALLAVTDHADGWPLFAALSLGGIGLGASNTSILAIVTNAVPPRFSADLSGLINMNSQMFNLIGVATIGTLYLALQGAQPATSSIAFAVSVGTLAAITLVSAIFGARAARSSASVALEDALIDSRI